MKKKIAVAFVILMATFFGGKLKVAHAADVGILNSARDEVFQLVCDTILDTIPTNGSQSCEDLRHDCQERVDVASDNSPKENLGNINLQPGQNIEELIKAAEQHRQDLEDAKQNYINDLKDACTAPELPAEPPAPAAMEEGSQAQDNLVSAPVLAEADGKGGCSLNALGGGSSNLWIAGLGLIPLILRRRSK